MTTASLLAEFPPVETAAWEEAIRKDLKGADYARKLIWQTEEGLAVKPYYRATDVEGLHSMDAAPGAFPYLRGTKTSGDWRIREEIDAADPEEANRAALSALIAGTEEIAFLHAKIADSSDLCLLLAHLQEIPVHFAQADEALLRLLIEHLGKHARQASTSTDFDPLSDVDFAAEILNRASAGLLPFTVQAAAFEEEGATAVEEIGFALAAGIDYLAAMQERGVAIEAAANAISFSFAIGANYFFQIAKLRAFRSLWARAVESFGASHESAKAHIHARTSRWNKTLYDAHVNILRATTEAMSAVLGGADSLTVAPFDECYKQPDEASRRLARNTQILLKQEALFARVADPGAGSYCLETITDYLAREGWKSMQALEAAGGFRKAQADGIVAQELQRSLAARDKAMAQRRRVFTGTNQYANRNEHALERIDAEHFNQDRGTWTYEQLRLRTERHAAKTQKTPRVILAEIGDVKMRGARSNFAANFFACAGFDISTQRFNQASEIAGSDTDLLVLCSSDAEYLPLTEALMAELKALNKTTPVVIAGNPESAEQLTAIGVADFIHIRSNPLATLAQWQQRLGIEE
jgi:methylmalonyl-CoA mutase